MGVLKDKSWLLSVADFLWSCCVIAPLVVTYWRGTWDLLEDWVYPEPATTNTPSSEKPWHQQLSGLTCYLLGLLLRLMLDIAM